MRLRSIPIVVLTLACVTAVPAIASAEAPAPAPAAAQGKWEKLGERQVDGKLDHDAVAVGREDGNFNAIQIKVEGSSLVMLDLKVTFGNGETFEPNTRLVFDEKTKSRIIDLPGTKRAIKRVDFKYGNLPGGGRARVELWGREVPAPPPAWQKVGERQVDGKADHDTLTVDDAAFTAIQLKVEGSSLVLYDVKVTFGNGEKFEPNTRLVFDKDTKSRVIDLPGNKRAIKRVDFRYSNLPGGGKARLELWGKT